MTVSDTQGESAGTRTQTPEGGAPLAGENPAYFNDPIKDALVNVVLELAGQVWIGRERQYALEDVLTAAGVVGADDVERYTPTRERQAELKLARDRFVADVFQELKRIGLMERQGD
jgi:hypothetical protein